jgi:hypothetical protein
MTEPDHEDRAPGMGDPNRSDDVAIPGLRTGGPGSVGSSAADQVAGPAPAAGDPSALRADPDPGRSGHQGGQLGPAGGGYGSPSADASSSGGPDGEDGQQASGPGPQTDWLRSATGRPETDEPGTVARRGDETGG